MSTQVDVLLYGLGAIGSFYAFILNRCSDVRLTVFARSNYDAVKDRGIEIRSEIHGQHIVKPFRVIRNPEEAHQTFEFIVCAHKAINQDSVAKQLKSCIDEDRTTIVLIQNGVGNEDPFRQLFHKTTIISTVTWVGASQPQPGVINHIKSEDLQIGLFPNSEDQGQDEARLEKFAKMLQEGGTVYHVMPNIQIQRWEKVVWNAAWNSLTALTMLDTQAWLRSSEYAMPLTRRLMGEVIEVAQKCGVPLEENLTDILIERILALPGITSSMQTDRRNNRPMEVEVILGTPVKKGRELGISIPTIETLYGILLAIHNDVITKSE